MSKKKSLRRGKRKCTVEKKETVLSEALELEPQVLLNPELLPADLLQKLEDPPHFLTLNHAVNDNIRIIFANAKDKRTRLKLEGFVLPTLLSAYPKTISSVIVQKGTQYEDWTSDYSLFSQSQWEPDSSFKSIIGLTLEHIPYNGTIVIIVDDSVIRKVSLKIPLTAYARDPIGQKFHTNLIIVQRFLEVSAIIQSKDKSICRAIPIAFKMIEPKSKEEKQEERRKNEILKILNNIKKKIEVCSDPKEKKNLTIITGALNLLLDRKIPADVKIEICKTKKNNDNPDEIINKIGKMLESVSQNGKLFTSDKINNAVSQLFFDNIQSHDRYKTTDIIENVTDVMDNGEADTEKECVIESGKRSTVAEEAHKLCCDICEFIHRFRPDIRIALAADGGFANEKFIIGDGNSKSLDEYGVVIVRCRKDSTFRRYLGKAEGARKYGEVLSKPEEVLGEKNIKAKEYNVKVPHSTKRKSVKVKTMDDATWPRVTGTKKGRVLCIHGETYNLNKKGNRSKTPDMYLYVVGGEMIDVLELLEWYYMRWEIEVGFRDQKFVLGLGKAHVWSKKSVSRYPGFMVCCYSALLLAAMNVFDGKCPNGLRGPKWDKGFSERRVSVTSMLSILRSEIRSA